MQESSSFELDYLKPAAEENVDDKPKVRDRDKGMTE